MRQSVIKEGKVIIENQEKKLKQIENLDYPDKEAPDTAYLEADATYISLQHRGKKEKEKLEVKPQSQAKFQSKSRTFFHSCKTKKLKSISSLLESFSSEARSINLDYSRIMNGVNPSG